MHVDARITGDFIGANISDRIVGFGSDSDCTASVTTKKVESWQGEGAYVVANAGAYDALGLNHIRGLTQARIIGAAYSIGSVEDLPAIYDLASSDAIRLLVSLDTNDAIRENKSFKDVSGNSVRPILDWDTRARMIGLQSIRSKHDLVDFVTKHGPGACTVCEGESCWHSDVSFSVASTGADLTIVKSLNPGLADRYGADRFHIIDESEGAFFDKVLDSQISTSALVRRVKKDME